MTNETASPRHNLLIAATVPGTLKAFLLPYADHFRARGWRVDALAQAASQLQELQGHFDNIFDIEWSRNPLSPANFTNNGKIVKLVEDGGYDIVHVHTPVAAFVMRRALRKMRAAGCVKVVYTAHGFHFYNGGKRWRNFIFRNLEKTAGKWTDRLIVINKEDFDAALKYEIVPEESLVHMPGIGLDFAKYDPENVTRDDIRSIRTELGMKEDDILYTMIAEFNAGKRHKDVILALSKTKNAQIHVAFAGEGKLRDKMQDLCRVYAVHQRTHFLGHTKDVKALIRASRATLIPSEREGLSRSGMESACLGTPIVGSDARGVRDVIQPNRGLVYPAGDILALRDAMLQLYEEPYGAVEPDPTWQLPHLLTLHETLYRSLFIPQHVETEESQ